MTRKHTDKFVPLRRRTPQPVFAKAGNPTLMCIQIFSEEPQNNNPHNLTNVLNQLGKSYISFLSFVEHVLTNVDKNTSVSCPEFELCAQETQAKNLAPLWQPNQTIRNGNME